MAESQVEPTNVQEALDNIWSRLKALEANTGIGPTKHGLTLRLIQDG